MHPSGPIHPGPVSLSLFFLFLFLFILLQLMQLRGVVVVSRVYQEQADVTTLDFFD